MIATEDSITDRLDAIESKLNTDTAADVKWLTVAKASKRSSLSEKSVRRLLDGGKLRAHRPVKGRVLIDVREFDGLIRNSTSKPRQGRGRSKN